jgi:F420 biosynthesis protein FbiB-like protein
VVKDLNTKQLLAEAMASKWTEDLHGDGVSSAERREVIGASVKRFTCAPIVVVVCLSVEHMDRYRDEKRREAEFVMGVQSVAAAIQNMLLVTHAEGLGACWFCAPLFCAEVVRNVLGVPEAVHPQALITLGYPDEKPQAPPRKPLADIVYQNKWGHI